jgi:pimeloyl-ACP methyl ester carboxylesterase
MLAMSPPVRAQEIEGENVKFDSADDVELRGIFYQGKKAKAPVAVLLHKYGGSREQAGWDKSDKSLVKELHDKGFAVLAFDFRGHGESTTVNAGFWTKAAANRTLIRGAKADRTKIHHKDFMRDYIPMLVNDVTAAKRFLDKQNDAGLVNSSSVILIGAEEGAAIGSLWLVSEWLRTPLIRTIGVRWVRDPQGRPPGEDVAAAIWLSPTSTLGGKNVATLLREQKGIREKVPMVFYAGKDDSAGSVAAKKLFDDLKKGGKSSDLTFLRIEDKAGKARGAEVLSKSGLKVPEEITKYLEKVIQKNSIRAWKMRDVDNGPPYVLVTLP